VLAVEILRLFRKGFSQQKLSVTVRIILLHGVDGIALLFVKLTRLKLFEISTSERSVMAASLMPQLVRE
jgi:hypothetical protein